MVSAVGAFHVTNHESNCQKQFDIRLVPGAGRSYGDNPEGVWGVQGRIGPSISEMGTGSREDLINMHFDDFNHQKVVGMGMREQEVGQDDADSHSVAALADRAKDAQRNHEITQIALQELEKRMSTNAATRRELERWKSEEVDWLRYIRTNGKLPEHIDCPYVARTQGGMCDCCNL